LNSPTRLYRTPDGRPDNALLVTKIELVAVYPKQEPATIDAADNMPINATNNTESNASKGSS
jgi:hypothetical protein